ncbi:MAG: acetoacetate decarboxylase family protein [Actinobacteria bacterium]|nr:acetoacetate decarboxylase family protein [Actinomycetota bacterium]
MAEGPAGWIGTGECLVCVVWRPANRLSLPPELLHLPGPQLVVAANYATSPVGSYLELAVAQPARHGARVGMCVTTIACGSAAASTAGRDGWGFPKELADLRWSEEDGEMVLRWESRGIEVRGTARASALPAVLPYSSLQRRADGPVWVTGRLRGSAQLARVELIVPADDELSFLAGRHGGAFFGQAAVKMGGARPL